MLDRGTAWQSDICMACLLVLALELSSTRLRSVHTLSFDASVASRTAAMTQHKLFQQLLWRVPLNAAPCCDSRPSCCQEDSMESHEALGKTMKS